MASRWSVVLAVVLLLVPIGAFVVEPTVHSSPEPPGKSPEDVKFVVLDSENTHVVVGHPDQKPAVWPYTSRQRDFDTLTLPINVVVKGSPSEVRSVMRADGSSWQDGNGTAPGESAAIPWDDTHGAMRYNYVTGRRWTIEAAQLHDGTYLGARKHARLYPIGRRTWTAVQVHNEYWDWYRLRHTVTSLSKAQYETESEFRGRRATSDISREWFANGGLLDEDGWVTIVELEQPSGVSRTDGTSTTSETEVQTPTDDGPGADSDEAVTPRWPDRRLVPAVLLGIVALVPLLGVGTGFGRVFEGFGLQFDDAPIRPVVLFSALTLLPAAVRVASVSIETTYPGIHPKIIVAIGYPLMAFVPPLLAVWIPRGKNEYAVAGAAASGFVVGMLFDYVVLGIHVIPVSVALHRLVLAVGLAALAAAGTRSDSSYRRDWAFLSGAVVWFLGLVYPLFVGI